MAENGEKVRKKKKRRKKHYFLRAVVFLAIVSGLIYFLNSPFFDIQKINVEGNSYFTSEQIIERSGLTTGRNIIFNMHKNDIKKTLMKEPYVKGVELHRHYPNKVTLIIEERTEAAVVPEREKFVVIDGEGLVLRVTEVEPQLTALKGLTVKSMKTGKALEVEENAGFSSTLSMINSMQNSEIYFKAVDLSKIIAKAYVNDVFMCQGMPEDIKNAIDGGTLQRLLTQLYNQGIGSGTVTVTADSSNMAYSPNYVPLQTKEVLQTEVASGTEVEAAAEAVSEKKDKSKTE